MSSNQEAPGSTSNAPSQQTPKKLSGDATRPVSNYVSGFRAVRAQAPPITNSSPRGPAARAPDASRFHARYMTPSSQTPAVSQTPNSITPIEANEFMSRWRVVSTSPVVGSNSDSGFRMTTTIEAHSPILQNRLAQWSQPSISTNHMGPYSIEQTALPNLKRKFKEFRTDGDRSHEKTPRVYHDLHTPELPTSPTISNKKIQPIAVDAESRVEDKEASNVPTTVSDPFESASAGTQLDNTILNSSLSPNTGIFKLQSVPAIHKPVQTSLQSPNFPKTHIEIQPSSRHTSLERTRDHEVFTSSGLDGLQSTSRGISEISIRKHLDLFKGNSTKANLSGMEESWISYDNIDIESDIPDLNSVECPQQIHQTFSCLHDEIWCEESISREDMDQQKIAYVNKGNKGKRTSRLKVKDQISKTKINHHNEALIPTCRRHDRKKVQNDVANDECDSDCFDEYDPLEDISELRAALQRLEKDSKPPRSNNALQGGTNQQRSTSYQRRPEAFRRPYLSFEARIRLLELQVDSRLDSINENRVHISFSEMETKRVWLSIHLAAPHTIPQEFSIETAQRRLRNFLSSPEYSKDEKQALLVSVAAESSTVLNGRTPEDISRYIGDALESSALPPTTVEIRVQAPRSQTERSSWHSLLLTRQLAGGKSGFTLPTASGDIQLTSRRKTLRLLKPYKFFKEGSSDVVDCAWDARSENFALACTTFNDEYNKPGNLLIGSPDGKIKYLSGHRTLRPPNQGNGAILDSYLHSTVSSVDFCGDLLYSASFDKTVRAWDVKERTLRRSLYFPAPVVRMKMHSNYENLGAACLQDGNVVVFRTFLGATEGEDLDACQVLNASQDHVEPSSVLWTSKKGRPGWLFIGYDSREIDRRMLTANAGDLRLYDAVRGIEIGGIKPGSTRQFDICLDESEQLLIAGASSNPANRPTPDTHSQVRLWDLRMPLHKVYELSCRHRDINKVTISSCSNYVTSSGTNGKSYIWDIRHGQNILKVLKHGALLESKTPLPQERDREEVDTGVTFASWTPCGSLLATASSDGLVKVWDPTKADPFLYNLSSFDDPVMSGSFSPDGDALIIGETTGKATVLSYMGGHGPPQPFVQDRSMLAPTASEAERGPSGIESAKTLLRTGQVVLVRDDDGQASVYGR